MDTQPRHMQIAAALRSRIAAGEWEVGSRIPSLKTLQHEYDVSEVTVHTAVRTLQAEGVLASTSGSGTYVAGLPREDEDLATAVKTLREDVADLTHRVASLERHTPKSTGEEASPP